VHPARFVVPTPKGLADILGIKANEVKPLGLSLSKSVPQRGETSFDKLRTNGFELSDAVIPNLLQTAAQKLLATFTDPDWPLPPMWQVWNEKETVNERGCSPS
jgi:hypothetical protein